MSNRRYVAVVLLAALALVPVTPALALGIVITHTKALAGNVTPGDAAGYPVSLTQPGRYELNGNLNPPAGTIGITINTDAVTIDFQGYRLFGSGTAWYGIIGGSGVDAVAIKNGTISNFLYDGINEPGNNWIIEDIQAIGNGRDGIVLAGFYATVRKTTSTENGARGIACGTRCLVQDSNVSGNLGVGIDLVSGLVLGNVIIANTSFGIAGSLSGIGYGNNTLAFNNNIGPEVVGATQTTPNYCEGGPCP